MLVSLPRVRSVVEISYGCIGRSARQPRTARASGLETRRRVMSPPITRCRVSGDGCTVVKTRRGTTAGPLDRGPAVVGGRWLPGVGDVDDQPRLVGGRPGEGEHPERQPGADAEAVDGDALERAARDDLAEGPERADVGQVDPRRFPVRPQGDLQGGPAGHRDRVPAADAPDGRV